MHWFCYGVFWLSHPAFLVSKSYDLQGCNAFVDSVFTKGGDFQGIPLLRSSEKELVAHTKEVYER